MYSIKLRRKNNVIVYGNYKIILEDDESIYAYLRVLGNEKLLVILNFSKTKSLFTLPNNIKFKHQTLLLSNYDVIDEKINRILLRPYEARVYNLIV